jgi:hypothetical protein
MLPVVRLNLQPSATLFQEAIIWERRLRYSYNKIFQRFKERNSQEELLWLCR